jgi:hypothetical protein
VGGVGAGRSVTLEIRGPRGDMVGSAVGGAIQDSVIAASWVIPTGQSGGEFTAHIKYSPRGCPSQCTPHHASRGPHNPRDPRGSRGSHGSRTAPSGFNGGCGGGGAGEGEDPTLVDGERRFTVRDYLYLLRKEYEKDPGCICFIRYVASQNTDALDITLLDMLHLKTRTHSTYCNSRFDTIYLTPSFS